MYTTNPIERHRACSPSNSAERSTGTHRALAERSTERSPSIPPSTFGGIRPFLCHAKKSRRASLSARPLARWPQWCLDHLNFPMLNPHRQVCKYGPHL